MPDFLTPQTLAAAGPIIFETFVKHFLTHRKEDEESESTSKADLLYEEAFVLAKTFLEISSKHPVAAIQRMSLSHTPSPPWVAIHRVIIPQSRLTPAAEYLVTAFGGEEMTYKITGGTKWWQVRAGPGVEAEWIVMKKDWKQYVDELDKGNVAQMPGGSIEEKDEAFNDDTGLMGETGGVSGEEGVFLPEMDRLRCLFFIHGGAYYWGSINTHRYVLWRLARKMRGRVFAVNYRKAPQYPFPCALQDVLAAWLYLVNPPAEAKHRPVNPKNIIIAGDSAGGGLSLALLQILRDTPGLELPAGAVLLSPWSDLTHSFPSILQNTATDVVPPYGFIHKPSSLWPPPPPDLSEEMQSRLKLRVREAVARMRDDHNITAMSSTSQSHVSPETTTRSSEPSSTGEPNKDPNQPSGEPHTPPDRANPAALFDLVADRAEKIEESGLNSTTLARCYEPLRLRVKDRDVIVDSQIQLYATNAQLCHPYVSPALGYLGGLPPLYILAGNNEVLRDEIIYVEDVKKLLPSLKDVEGRYLPTNVHLQVYDGVCHDLPLFSFTKPARGAYRAIASFCRYVTPSAPASLSILQNTGDDEDETSPKGDEFDMGQPITSSPTASPDLTPAQSSVDLTKFRNEGVSSTSSLKSPTPRSSRNDINPTFPSQPPKSLTSSFRLKFFPKSVEASTSSDIEHGRKVSSHPPRAPNPQSEPPGDDAGPRFGQDPADHDSKALPGTAGHSGIYRGANPFTDHMIRERVAMDGTCRPLEPESELSAMTMPSDEIGFIKEGPAIRYLNGQALWDKKFRHTKKQVAKHRQKSLKNSREHDAKRIASFWQEKIRSHDEKLEAERRLRIDGADGVWSDIEDGTVSGNRGGENEGDGEGNGKDEGRRKEVRSRWEKKKQSGREKLLLDQSWSWTWALKGEAPPPSAIVSRRDFTEARHLALMADRVDDQRQSEIGGLSIWVGLASFFSNSQARNKSRQAFEDARKAQKTEKKTMERQRETNKQKMIDDGEGKGLGKGRGEKSGNGMANGVDRVGSKDKHGSGTIYKIGGLFRLNKDRS